MIKKINNLLQLFAKAPPNIFVGFCRLVKWKNTKDKLEKVKGRIFKITTLTTNKIMNINQNKKLNTEASKPINMMSSYLLRTLSVSVVIFSFLFSGGVALAVDTTAPYANMTYSANPAKASTTITATFSEAITSAPTISIDQPGTTDISNASMTTVEPGSSFTSQSLVAGSTFYGSAYGDGTYVMVGTNGKISYSSNGINWTTITGPEVNTWISVTYGNGLFVAISSSGTHRVITSPDGITWTVRDAAEANTWNGVTYGNGLFVAVSSDGTHRVMTSSDGITWTARDASEVTDWYDVTYGSGLFVAVANSGTNKIMTSTDGITWTGRTSPIGGKYISYGNGLFVAGTNSIMTSPDGINWTSRSLENNYYKDVAYGNGMWIVVAYATYGGTHKYMRSSDGINWVGVDTFNGSGVTGQPYTITYGNGMFIVGGGSNAALYTPAYQYSYDYTVNQANGSTYVDGTATVSLSTVQDEAGNNSTTPTNNTFTIDTTAPNVALSYTNSTAGVGTNTINAIYNEAMASAPTVSIDQPGTTDITNATMNEPGSTWTQVAPPELNAFSGVTYGNGLYVAVSSDGTWSVHKIFSSPDGITWTARGDTNTNGWQAVTYGNGLFVAVSGSGSGQRVITSPDGINWTLRDAAEANSWYNVAYGNGLFVAVARDGTHRVMTSPDGVTWTARTSAEQNDWRGIVYGNGLWVAVSYDGTHRVMTSSDGITWTARTEAEANAWMSVAYGNGRFVAVAYTGTNQSMYSLDGITWVSSDIDTSSNRTYRGVAYGDGYFVAASYTTGYRIATSPDGITWTQRSAATNPNYTNVGYGNGRFIIVALNGTYPISVAPSGYNYNYTVNLANGSTYVDGTATVSLSTVQDVAGNNSTAPTNNTFNIDTVGPTVALTYSKNTAGVGTNTVTATYSENISGTPTISINQQGSTDITNVAMSGSGTVWTYDYTVNQADGSTYIDGTATVSLSTVTDIQGNSSSAPTNTTFTIETVPPTAGITYSINHPVKSGDSLVITATFNEAMADSPAPKIAISGANTLSAADMTKVDSTHYTYTHTVGSGNGTATVALSVGTDVPGNIITSTPTSGSTFTVDSTAPSTTTITSICSTSGNGCTVYGEAANPQESYMVNSIRGTSSDDVGGSGLSTVEVSIKDTETNLWYNGSLFASASEVYIAASGTTTWVYDTSSILLTIDHTYSVNVKASDAALNTEIIPLTFVFTNSPPTVSNVTASQNTDDYTIVDVTYDVTDIESSQTTNYLFYGVGATLNGDITNSATSLVVSSGTNFPNAGAVIIENEIISYTGKSGNTLTGLTRGDLSTTPRAHTSGTDVSIKAVSVTGNGVGASNLGTGKVITWDAKTDADGYESATGVIKVVANDGSAGSMIGWLNSDTFSFDESAPVVSEPITFDAGVAGSANSASITIPLPTDMNSVYYRITDDVGIETNPNDTGWVLMTEETTIPWSFDSGIEVKTLNYQWKDSIGNTVSSQSVSTHTPVPSGSSLVQDTSNVSANPPYYDLYIGWQATSATGFASYKLEYSTSSDNSTYGSYTTISNSGFSDANTNYYVYRNLDPDLFYRFRLAVVDTNGNVSVRSNSYTTTKPDGVQNYGEGGGGSVLTAPKVENVVVVQNSDKTVDLDYKLTDASLGKKVNPTYEAYLFYNIGVTLPSNALSGSTITVSDASKLKSAGYIQINNEVIKYTGKSGNILTGVVRGTWPTNITSGRTTRTNATLFAGTPVWILATGTTPISLTDTTITTGEDFSMTWNTYSDSNIAGSSYTNVGLKVVVHDNQDALSGPLSSQNDYSESGILNTLDLTAPTIAFTSTSSSGDESTTPVNITIDLARAYPLDATVIYTITGTATSGSDYTLSNGTATITAGNTQTSISLPITNDSLKELDETVIITLSSPTNATLGSNTVYTYTITDNDTSSGVEFESSSSSGDESETTVLIPISLAEVAGANVTIDYTITGTATSGSDYTLSNGTATILAGETETNISIPVVDDILKEDDETIIITLSNASGATLGATDTHTYTITDNDLYPTVGFSSFTSQSNEDVNTVDIPVVLSAVYAEDVTVNYAVTGGDAEGDSVDYLLADGTVTITAGGTTGNIHIVVFDDEIAEETETIIITLSNPTKATLSGTSVHSYSIIDNEIGITSVESTIKSTSAVITWSTGDYTDSLIEYGTIAPGSVGAYASSKSNSTKVLDHSMYLGGLTPSTTYYFRTTSTNLAGDVTTSESSFTTTAGPVISGVSTSSVTDTSVTITWDTNLDSSSYVNYSLNSDLSSSTRSGSTSLTTTHSVTLVNLNSEATYYFSVDSTDGDGNIGEDRNGGGYYTVTTGADQTAPVISSISTPIITSSQVAVVWTTNEEASGMIRYSTVSGNYSNSTETIENPSTSHLIAISSLEVSTTYYYVIESADSNGNTTTSDEQTFKTAAPDSVVISGGSTGVAQELYDIILAENQKYKNQLGEASLGAPEISNIEISNITAFGATVSFDTSDNTIVFIKYGKDSEYGSTTGDSVWAKSHTIKLTGLSLGTKYYFEINAITKSNAVGVSDVETFTTKFLSEDLEALKNIDNIEQFQAEIENTIESILPSLVPPFVDKPIVSDIREDGATVTFRTNIKAYPVVSYTTDDKYDANKEDPYDGQISDTSTKGVSHTVNLIGLKSNTKYHIKAKAFSLPEVIGESEDITFITSASKIRGSVIDVKTSSFNVVWTTDEPTSSIIEYKNTKTGRISRIVDGVLNSSHSVLVESLVPDTMYEVNISGVNAKGNTLVSGDTLNVRTSLDNNAPTINNLKVDSSLIVGRNDKAQTIISWQTDEPSTSTVYYEEGVGSTKEELANKEENLELTKNHTVILNALKAGTIYRFTVDSADSANNITKSPVRTIITPKKTESIVDIIFKNFDDTFNFINNVK